MKKYVKATEEGMGEQYMYDLLRNLEGYGPMLQNRISTSYYLKDGILMVDGLFWSTVEFWFKLSGSFEDDAVTLEMRGPIFQKPRDVERYPRLDEVKADPIMYDLAAYGQGNPMYKAIWADILRIADFLRQTRVDIPWEG